MERTVKKQRKLSMLMGWKKCDEKLPAEHIMDSEVDN
jgi:hypothetical protein